jgi:hypothetical protein
VTRCVSATSFRCETRPRDTAHGGGVVSSASPKAAPSVVGIPRSCSLCRRHPQKLLPLSSASPKAAPSVVGIPRSCSLYRRHPQKLLPLSSASPKAAPSDGTERAGAGAPRREGARGRSGAARRVVRGREPAHRRVHAGAQNRRRARHGRHAQLRGRAGGARGGHRCHGSTRGAPSPPLSLSLSLSRSTARACWWCARRPPVPREHSRCAPRTAMHKLRIVTLGFRWEMGSRGRFATPDFPDFPRHDGSPYSHAHERPGRVGVVHRSKAIRTQIAIRKQSKHSTLCPHSPSTSSAPPRRCQSLRICTMPSAREDTSI